MLLAIWGQEDPPAGSTAPRASSRPAAGATCAVAIAEDGNVLGLCWAAPAVGPHPRCCCSGSLVCSAHRDLVAQGAPGVRCNRGGMQLRLCGVVFAGLIKQKKGGKKRAVMICPSSSSIVILGSCWLPWITEPLVVSHCSEPEGVGLGHSEPCGGGESSKKCHKCNT